MLYHKYINENVFGSIPVTKTEFDLINTRAFQRLRTIKQLGLSNLVFPSADHTRFAHSLGVMHIVGRMAKRLVQLGRIKGEDIKKIRIAGLLHDIGHYPLSHLGEKVYMYGESKSVSQKLKSKISNTLTKVSRKPSNGEAAHENLGKYVIQQRSEINNILVRDGFDPLEIAQIIRAEHINFIYGQLISSGLDADRLDYLLRDTMQTGAKYGLVDLDYLIENLDVGTYEGTEWLGVNKKAIHAVEHFLMARYFAYSQVTWHKTICGFETMAAALFLKMRQKGYVYSDISAIKEIVNNDEWLCFTDEYFYRKLEDYVNNEMSYEINILYSSLLNRRRAKLIIEAREFIGATKGRGVKYKALYNLLNKEDKLSELKKVLANNGIDEITVFDQELDLKIDKVPLTSPLENMGDEYLKETVMIIEGGKALPISTYSSSIIKSLKENNLYCLRLYILDNNPTGDIEVSNNLFNKITEDIGNIYQEELSSLKNRYIENVAT